MLFRSHLERIAAWIRSLSSGKQSPPGDSEPSGVVHAANFAKDQTPTSNVKSAQAVKEIPNGKGSVVLAGSSETNTGRKRVVGASDPASPDRSAKLSKPPRSGTGSLAIDARDLAEIEDEIQRLEKIADKQSKKSDPFDAKIFNSKYSKGGGKPPPPLP